MRGFLRLIAAFTGADSARSARRPILISLEEALARKEAGEALAEIGRSYNVSHSTISRLG